MADSDSPDRPERAPEDRVAAFLARMEHGQGVPGPCPPPERLAGMVEGRLLDRERDATEGHCAACEACRADVLGLLREGGATAEAGPPGAARILPFRLGIGIAAAAAILVAVALLGDGPGRTPRDTATEVADAAGVLARARPDLFGGFRPVGPGDPLPASLAPKRGARALLAPAGKVLDLRPEFRWEAAPGVARWRVALETDEGEPIWEAEATGASLPFPAERPDLEPGRRYLWEASGEGPLGPVGARRSFDVATAAERSAFGEAAREIDRTVPERLRPLLRAHLALRRGYLLQAEEEAAAFARAAPADAAGREVLEAARRALGRPEAGAEER